MNQIMLHGSCGMIKCIIFDVDGTLVDSSYGLFDSFSYASKIVGLKAPEKSLFKKNIGPPIDKIFNNFYEDKSHLKENFIKSFRKHYDNKGYLGYKKKFDLKKLEGVKNKNIYLGIVTNKPSMPTKNILKDMSLIDMFNMVTCKDTYNISYDKKDNLKKIISVIKQKITISDSEFVYVGDTLEDFDAANHCEISFAAISDGFYKWKSFSGKNIYPSLDNFLEIHL